LLDEINTYNSSKIHAKNSAVSELLTIYKAIGTEGDPETAAVTNLSNGKLVVRIKLDSSKDKYEGYAEWKGQRL